MKHTPLSTADKLMLGDIFKGEQYEFIVHAVNMHEELVQALINLLAFPQNESIKDMARKAISQAERK